MAATQVLADRNNKKIVEQKFIDRMLKEEAHEIFRAQDRIISRHNVTKMVPEITRRRFSVSNNRLTVTHPIRQRFIDMKNIRGQRQRSIQIHNKIVYGHFNNIIKKLAFGFTEDVKNMIAQEHKIQL